MFNAIKVLRSNWKIGTGVRLKLFLQLFSFSNISYKFILHWLSKFQIPRTVWFKNVFSAFNNNDDNNIKSDTLFSLTEAQEKQGQVHRIHPKFISKRLTFRFFITFSITRRLPLGHFSDPAFY